VVFHRNREDLERLGVLFCDMDTAVREYPDLVRKYFGTVIPPNDNKFAALNSAVWSGGSFIYVPPASQSTSRCRPTFASTPRTWVSRAHAHHRRRRIQVHYVEGCSAPVYSTDSLHLGGRRARRPARLAHHLHHHSELVEQRLQPRDEARSRRSRGARRVDRWQYRVAAHHEVPRRST